MHANRKDLNQQSTLAACAVTIATITGICGAATTARAERGEIPVLQQVTRNTTGEVSDVGLRSELADWITFTSNGDVLGPGTETTGREIYIYNTVTGTTTKVTTTPGGESYSGSRVSDATFASGRPNSLVFASTGDFDPTRGNADHNPEIFVYDVDSGAIHQVTDTLPPVVNSEPFASDSARCIAFASNANLDNNPGNIEGNPGAGFKNPDGSREIFSYEVDADSNLFPYAGVYTQVSNGPAGTTSEAPTMGGYIWGRQCQTVAYLSNHAQLGDAIAGTNIYFYDRTSADIARMTTGERPSDGGIAPAGVYGPPKMSNASNFARGPYIVFSTAADVWNNGNNSLEAFRFRVFHPRMTQYTGIDPGDVFDPQISDGGGYIVFGSNGELLNEKHGAKDVGPGPFNADQNEEIFQLRGRRKVWQITNSLGCDSYEPSIQDNGSGIAFISTCDLVPGNNPTGIPQVFFFRRVKSDDAVLHPGNCDVLDGCCDEANGCYTDLRGLASRPPKRNDLD